MHSLNYFQFTVVFSHANTKDIDVYARSQGEAVDILINMYPEAIGILILDPMRIPLV